MPTQTFPNSINDLRAYINTHIIPNGIEEITGEIDNNVDNGIVDWIIKSMVNNALVSIVVTAGAWVINKPMTVFLTITPASIQWPDDFQNEYYFINTTGFPIPLATGFTYFDPFATTQTSIPANSVVHIAKAVNLLWVQVNNLGGGGGGGGGLPPQANHQGETLFTNGNAAFWGSNFLQITSADFSTPTIYNNTNIPPSIYQYAVFWNDIPRMIYYDPLDPTYPASEWKPVPTGGVEVLIPGFDSTINNYHLWIFLRGFNAAP